MLTKVTTTEDQDQLSFFTQQTPTFCMNQKRSDLRTVMKLERKSSDLCWHGEGGRWAGVGRLKWIRPFSPVGRRERAACICVRTVQDSIKWPGRSQGQCSYHQRARLGMVTGSGELLFRAFGAAEADWRSLERLVGRPRNAQHSELSYCAKTPRKEVSGKNTRNRIHAAPSRNYLANHYSF